MKLIPISGKAGHGKDTIAEMMKRVFDAKGKRTLIIHYGDLVKFIATKFFGWDEQKDEKGRTLLQQIGTERIRSKSPDYWVEFVLQVLSFFPDEWDYVLIPDARFPNEIESLKNAGYNVWHIRIVRPGYNILTEEQQKHASETSLNDYPVDTLVYNAGTLDDLSNDARKIAEEILEE